MPVKPNSAIDSSGKGTAKAGVSPKPAPAAPTKVAGPEWTGALREIVAAAISLVILSISAYMLMKVFWSTASTEYDEMKDIMLYGLSFLGTILGYYFGRVPAERRAEKAEEQVAVVGKQATAAHRQAGAAQQDANEARAEHQRTKGQAQKKLQRAEQMLDDLLQGGGGVSGVLAGEATSVDVSRLEGARSEIRSLLDDLS